MDYGNIAAGLGLVIVLVGGVNLGRNKRKSELIQLQEQQAEALRHEIADKERRCDEKVAAQDAIIHDLKGRVAVLQDQQAAAMIAAIAPAVAEAVAPLVIKAIRDGEW